MTTDHIDRSRARGLILALAPDLTDLRGTIVPGEPRSQARPRTPRGGGPVYKLPEDRTAERRTATFLRQTWARPLVGNLAVVCIFYRSTLRTVDSDNLLKHVYDAGQGVVWVNDRQITGGAQLIELDREHPRTVIAVCRHQSTMWRGPKGGNQLQPELLTVEPQPL